MNFISFIIFVFALCQEFPDQEIIYHTNYLKYRKENHDIVSDKSITISNIKISNNGRIFVTIPRVDPERKAPFTLGYFDESFTLNPFPNYKTNKCSSNDCLFNVNAIEIDRDNRLWVIDSGMYGNSSGTVKIMIYDLDNSNEDEDEASYSFFVNESFFNTKYSFFSDLSLDAENEIAFFTDSGSPFEDKIVDFQSAIVAFDLNTKQTKRVLNTENQTKMDERRKIETLPTALTGVTLHCDLDKMIYTRVDTNEIKQIDTKVILMYNDEGFINSTITKGSEIRGNYPAIIFDNKQRCFIADASRNKVIYSKQDKMGKEDGWKNLTLSSKKNLTYPYKFAFYNNSIYILSNNFYEFIHGDMKKENMYNYAIWKVKTDSDSYVGGCSFVGYRVAVAEYSLMGAFFGSVVVCAILVIISEYFLQFIVKLIKDKKQNP